MKLFKMSAQKLLELNKQRAQYEASKNQMEKFAIYLKKRAGELADGHQKKLLENMCSAISDMIDEVNELEEENKTAQWYQSATCTLTTLFNGMTQPDFKNARLFMDAADALQKKSCFSSDLQRKKNAGLFFARVFLCLAVISLIGVSVFLPVGTVFALGLAAWTFNVVAYGSFSAIAYSNVTKIDEKLDECAKEFGSHIQIMHQLINNVTINSELNSIASDYCVYSGLIRSLIPAAFDH